MLVQFRMFYIYENLLINVGVVHDKITHPLSNHPNLGNNLLV